MPLPPRNPISLRDLSNLEPEFFTVAEDELDLHGPLLRFSEAILVGLALTHPAREDAPAFVRHPVTSLLVPSTVAEPTLHIACLDTGDPFGSIATESGTLLPRVSSYQYVEPSPEVLDRRSSRATALEDALYGRWLGGRDHGSIQLGVEAQTRLVILVGFNLQQSLKTIQAQDAIAANIEASFVGLWDIGLTASARLGVITRTDARPGKRRREATRSAKIAALYNALDCWEDRIQPDHGDSKDMQVEDEREASMAIGGALMIIVRANGGVPLRSTDSGLRGRNDADDAMQSDNLDDADSDSNDIDDASSSWTSSSGSTDSDSIKIESPSSSNQQDPSAMVENLTLSDVDHASSPVDSDHLLSSEPPLPSPPLDEAALLRRLHIAAQLPGVASLTTEMRQYGVRLVNWDPLAVEAKIAQLHADWAFFQLWNARLGPTVERLSSMRPPPARRTVAQILGEMDY